DGVEVALRAGAGPPLELLPEMAGNGVQRLLGRRAAFDSVGRLRLLEAPLQLLDERALARADRAHQIEDLPALLALQRGRMEVAHDLRDRLLDLEELVAEEIVDLERLVLVEPLHARVVGLVDVLRADAHARVVKPRMGELRNAGVVANEVEILEEGPAPDLRFARSAVLFDQLLEGG